MTGSHVGRRTTSTRRWSAVGVLGTATALLTLGLMSPASSTTAITTGSWQFYPGQTYTDVAGPSIPGDTVYKTAVRPPINPDGSSNFPAKRGVIPVQFDLLAATSTTATTTRTWDPPVWQSIGSDSATGNDVTFALFNPSVPLTVNQVTNLSATYNFTEGDCYVGSLRWTINTDAGNVYVYYGNPNGDTSAGQSCTGEYTETGKNLADPTDASLPVNRFEVEGAGSPVYIDHASAMTLAGSRNVNWVQLVVESGWHADQKLDVSNVTVNDNTWVPKSGSETILGATTPGTFAKTCVLPPAEIAVTKTDSSVTGAINEVDSIQPKDDGVYFRQVDCKYIYNLAVSSLKGQGTYKVYANIGETNLSDPAVFDLR
jgi:hypothetical protein